MPWPLDDAVAAHERGDYATALRLYRRLAFRRVRRFDGADCGVWSFGGGHDRGDTAPWFR